MADDIVEQLHRLAETLDRGKGKSTVYGAITEIERLRALNDSLQRQLLDKETRNG